MKTIIAIIAILIITTSCQTYKQCNIKHCNIKIDNTQINTKPNNDTVKVINTHIIYIYPTKQINKHKKYGTKEQLIQIIENVNNEVKEGNDSIARKIQQMNQNINVTLKS